MAGRESSRANRKAVTRMALLAGGALLASWQMGGLLREMGGLRQRFGGAPGVLGGAGFASLHLLRSAAFHPEVVFWFVSKILVLFLAIAIIVTGLAMLRRGDAGASAQNVSTRGSDRGEQ